MDLFLSGPRFDDDWVYRIGRITGKYFVGVTV
jgi:hypothetical protein